MIRSKSADPLYRFIRKGKAGYIDRSGKVVIEPKLGFYGNSGDEFHGGLLQIGFGESKYMDATGKLVIDKGYYRAWEFSDGLAVAMKKDGEKWGYIDSSGEFAISPRFDSSPNGYVYSFSDSLAMIEVGKKYGYIDRSGKFVIEPKFLLGADFKDGMARVVVEGPCVYSKLYPCPDVRTLPEGSEGPAASCKFTFIDKAGSVITDERYDDAKDFSEGLAPVLVGDKWGYIDKRGRMVIVPAFDEAEPFSEGLALVKTGELFGYINRIGDFAIPPQFKSADNFSDGLAAVSNTWNKEDYEYEDFYYINKRGKQAIAGKFVLASHFFKGLAHVQLKSNRKLDDYRPDEGTYAYIDVTGKKVFTYEYELED